jgi:hypothetical protein
MWDGRTIEFWPHEWVNSFMEMASWSAFEADSLVICWWTQTGYDWRNRCRHASEMRESNHCWLCLPVYSCSCISSYISERAQDNQHRCGSLKQTLSANYDEFNKRLTSGAETCKVLQVFSRSFSWEGLNNRLDCGGIIWCRENLVEEALRSRFKLHRNKATCFWKSDMTSLTKFSRVRSSVRIVSRVRLGTLLTHISKNLIPCSLARIYASTSAILHFEGCYASYLV